MEYDYLENMIKDVITYIETNYTDEDIAEYLTDEDTRQDWAEVLDAELWTEDSVTGNASGSYTFNTYNAEEYLAHNWDLLAEALEEYGSCSNILEKGAEWRDVTIRCYLLGQDIAAALDSLQEKS